MAQQSITLVTNFETGGTKEFFQSKHIKGSVTLEGLEIGKELAKKGDEVGGAEIREVASFIAKDLYAGQFTSEELIDGLDARELIESLMNQLTSVFGSSSGNATKVKKN